MQISVSSRRYDWILLLAIISLAGWSLFHLYTITFPHQTSYFFRQMVWVGIGIGLMFLFSSLKISFWEKGAYFFYGAILLFLLLVLIRGESVYGAQRWLGIAMIGFQPSEFAKLSLIIVLSRLLANEEGMSWKQVGLSFFFTFTFLILVALQPDLGSALLLLFLCLGILFLAGISFKRLLVILGIGSSLFPLFYFLLRPYQKMRILTFLNPGRDPLGAGWSALQSKIALGSGRLIGKGIGGALHTQGRFLPQPFTDFIFATLGEEWGFMGVLLILGLYFIIMVRGMKIVRQENTSFARLLSSGIIILLFLQVFINIGMAVGMMPVTGIPLPLMSYGGSSTLMFFTGIGILLSIKRFRGACQ